MGGHTQPAPPPPPRQHTRLTQQHRAQRLGFPPQKRSLTKTHAAAHDRSTFLFRLANNNNNIWLLGLCITHTHSHSFLLGGTVWASGLQGANSHNLLAGFFARAVTAAAATAAAPSRGGGFPSGLCHQTHDALRCQPQPRRHTVRTHRHKKMAPDLACW